jgi:CheY-like chemotaxis protein
VVTDIRMPGMDGMELLRHLNPASGVRRLPVIVMTGHGDVPLAVEAMKLGALDFLEKPFDDDRLIGMVETALSQGESSARGEAASAEMAARVASLTPRERQVMQGLVAGLSNKAIARDFDITPDRRGLPGQCHDQDAGSKSFRTGQVRDPCRDRRGLTPSFWAKNFCAKSNWLPRTGLSWRNDRCPSQPCPS